MSDGILDTRDALGNGYVVTRLRRLPAALHVEILGAGTDDSLEGSGDIRAGERKQDGRRLRVARIGRSLDRRNSEE